MDKTRRLILLLSQEVVINTNVEESEPAVETFYRLLESGDIRLLESSDKRLLEV